MTITPEMLTKITPSIKGQKAIDISVALNEILPIYKMDSADIMHEFWANVLEESWEMGHFAENLNYRAERICVVWPKRFPTLAMAVPYAHNPEKLANKVYGGRMGNILPNDGFDFRGSGPIQLTGRDTMVLFTKFLNRGDVRQVADELRTDLKLGLHSACWFFAIYKRLIPLAISDNMKEVIRRINGGTTNLSKRLAYYDKCKKYIP